MPTPAQELERPRPIEAQGNGLVDQSASADARIKAFLLIQQAKFQNKLQERRNKLQGQLDELAGTLSSNQKVNIRLIIDSNISYGERLRLRVFPQEQGNACEAEILLNHEFALRLVGQEQNTRMGTNTYSKNPIKILEEQFSDARRMLYGDFRISPATNNVSFQLAGRSIILNQRLKQHCDQLIDRLPTYQEDIDNKPSTQHAIYDYVNKNLHYMGQGQAGTDIIYIIGLEEEIEELKRVCIEAIGEAGLERLEELTCQNEETEGNHEVLRNLCKYLREFAEINGYYRSTESSTLRNLMEGTPCDNAINNYNRSNDTIVENEPDSIHYRLGTNFYRDNGTLAANEDFKIILEPPLGLDLEALIPSRDISIILSEIALNQLLNAKRLNVPHQLIRDINNAVMNVLPAQFRS